jgi:hypothetical protein
MRYLHAQDLIKGNKECPTVNNWELALYYSAQTSWYLYEILQLDYQYSIHNMSEFEYIIFWSSTIILLLSISNVCCNDYHQEKRFIKLEGKLCIK